MARAQKTEKSQPGGSSVHINVPVGGRKRVKKLNVNPPLNNDGVELAHAAVNLETGADMGDVGKDNENPSVPGSVGHAEPAQSDEYDSLFDMQQIVSGTDFEMQMNGIDEETAQDAAFSNLQSDPDFYRKKWAEMNASAEGVDKNVVDPKTGAGICLDLGSGNARETGHLGVDLYPYDSGTLVHDLTLGLPFPDQCAAQIRLINTLDDIDMDDPKPLLAEIQRVLAPGGQFHYEGPDALPDYPGWTDSNDAGETGDGGDTATAPVRQRFTKSAAPDPAIADDAEPRIGVSQYDDLPSDALLAMDALGYYWSDAETSGRGNRVYGYPSQGALTVSKGGPGSGPQPGHGGGKTIEEHNANVAQHEKNLKNAKAKESKERMKYIKGESKTSERHDAARSATDTAHQNLVKAHEDRVAAIKEKLGEALDHHAGLLDKKNHVGKGFAVESRDDKTNLTTRLIPIAKISKAKQIVYGIVLSPDEFDDEDDIISADEIEKTAHSFLVNSRVIGGMHEQPMDAALVESYCAPVDFELTDTPYGPQKVKQGTWIIGVRINDKDEWQKVVDGEYQGFSVGGFGLRDKVA